MDRGLQLKRMREAEGISQQKLAQMLGVSQPSISNWENGNVPLPDDIWETLCERFPTIVGRGTESATHSTAEVDIDEEETQEVESELSRQKAFSEWLINERVKRGLSRGDLAEKAGVSYLTIYNIETGRISNPQKRTLVKLEDALATQAPITMASTVSEGFEPGSAGGHELIDFDPHDEAMLPDCPGVYVFYDKSGRPIYVGRSISIRNRILQGHRDKFWFREPIVQSAAYIRIEDKQLRADIEKILIRFLRSTAVLNEKLVWE